MPDRTPVLLFLHVPKAAGLSLLKVLRRQYGRDEVFAIEGTYPEESVDRFKELPASERSRYQLVFGHMSYGLHEWIDRPCEYATMLRDPIDRTTSAWYYILTRPDHPRYAEAKALEGAIAAGIRGGIVPDNKQVRMLANVDHKVIAVGLEHYEQARENLWKMAFVGLSSEFDRSLVLMGRRFGWRQWSERVNVTPNRRRAEDLDTAAREALLDTNRWDLLLYADAVRMFENATAAYGPRRLGTEVAVMGAGMQAWGAARMLVSRFRGK